MELLNATKMVAGYTQGIDKHAREYIIVAVKGTFTLPLDGGPPVLAEKQEPLVEVDDFTGEPGFSSTLHECDYALEKPRCDVIINGSAFAPDGKPASVVKVGLKMPGIKKVFNVVGDRFWIAGTTGISKTFAKSFTQKFISYDVAFGGTDNFHPNPEKKDAYMANPVGRGFHRYLESNLVNDTPLPNTEALDESVSDPKGQYTPKSFGCMGRSWPDRVRYAGTYDQSWIDNVFPFLPEDFDHRYYQTAPEDQQCAYLQGGEKVQLLNLTSTGFIEFEIPKMQVPVVFFKKRNEDKHTLAVADTLIIEPDKGIFSITWRTSDALKDNMFEISEVLVGDKTKAWWRARKRGKTYYRSLASLARDRTISA